MTVQVFDLSELVNKCINVMPSIDNEPFRIRLRFEDGVNRKKRGQVIALLRRMGYKQIGNTSSWVLNQKHLETD